MGKQHNGSLSKLLIMQCTYSIQYLYNLNYRKKKMVEQIKEKLKIDKYTLERQLQKYQSNFKVSIALEGRRKTTSVL